MTLSRLSAFAAILSVAVPACHKSSRFCSADSQCTLGEVCRAGICQAPELCNSDTQCNVGEVCRLGTCETVDAGPVQTVGASCYSSAQCESDLFCALDGTGLSGGLCAQSCATGSCPSNTICADLRATPVNAQICVPTIGDGGACREGWAACATLGGACLPSSLCPAAGLSSSASAGLGAACTPGSCASGEHCRFGADFPGGACTRACSMSDATTCPSNGQCVITDQGPLCLPTCQTAASCRTGYGCAAPTGTTFVCTTQVIGQRACGSGATPLLVSGGTAGPASAPPFCIEPVAASTLPAEMVQRFGARTVGDKVQFQVPAQAASISIISQAISARASISYQGRPLDNTVVPTQLTTPSGTVIYNDSAALPTDLSTVPVYYQTDSPATGVMTFPNTTAGLVFSDGGLPAGTWLFLVNDYAAECLNTNNCDGGSSDGLYDVSVLVKRGAPASSATLDIAFYLVGAQGLTAANAASSSHVQRMLTTLAALYAQAGLCLGTVTFYDVPAWAQARYATGISADKLGPCDDLSQMFTLARAGNTLNYFLVEQISSTSAGGSVVGLDGTIPGPSTLGGTIHSGAAVSAADLNAGSCSGGIDLQHCGADLVAYIAAHEGGHWMGLYHTTEATGDFYDPLSDTSTCSCTDCTTGARKAACGASSNPTYVEARDCLAGGTTCGGGDDLMFWFLDPSLSQGKLSAQQGAVMRSNLLAQ